MFSSERMSADRIMNGSSNAESSVDCFNGPFDRVWMGAANDRREETQELVKAFVWKSPSRINTEKRQHRIAMFSTTQGATCFPTVTDSTDKSEGTESTFTVVCRPCVHWHLGLPHHQKGGIRKRRGMSVWL